MSQCVGGSLLRQSGGCDVGFQQSADAASCQAPSETIEEHGGTLFFRGFGIGMSLFEPVVESFGGIAADGSESFPATFPEHSHDAGSAIPVIDIESDQLRDSQSGGVHGFQNGSITNSLGAVCGGSGQQRTDLFGGKEVGQFATTAGSAQRFGRVCFADAIAIAEAEEAAEAGESAGDGGAGIAAFVKPGHIAAEDRGIDLRGVWDFPGVFLQEFADVIQVIGVGLDGQIGRISFDSEEAEESLDGRIHGFCFAGSVRIRSVSGVLSVVAGVVPPSIGRIAGRRICRRLRMARENAVCDCAEGGVGA